MSRAKKIRIALDLMLFCVLVSVDQFTKYLAALKLKDHSPVVLVKNVFELYYYGNSGAAFGILQNQKIFFIFIAVVILAAICYVIVRIPDKKKYRSMNFFLVMIASGAVGNMIDRFRRGYVVDFLYFKLINFPIFNVADIYVTCATVLLTVFILFIYKDDELSFLSIRQKKYREVKTQREEQAEPDKE